MIVSLRDCTPAVPQLFYTNPAEGVDRAAILLYNDCTNTARTDKTDFLKVGEEFRDCGSSYH